MSGRRRVTVDSDPDMSRKGSVFDRLGGGSHRYEEEEQPVCKYYQVHGVCDYGNQCKFSHDRERRDEEADLRHRMKRRRSSPDDRHRRSESGSPEREVSPRPGEGQGNVIGKSRSRKTRKARRHKSKDKEKVKSAVVRTKQSRYNSSDEDGPDWDRPTGGGDDATLDFKTELMLVKKRQELQRELKRLQENDSAANSPTQHLHIEAMRGSSSESDTEIVTHKKKKKKEKKKKEKKRDEKKTPPFSGKKSGPRTPSPEDMYRERKKHKDQGEKEKKKKVKTKTKVSKSYSSQGSNETSPVAPKKIRSHEVKPIPYDKPEKLIKRSKSKEGKSKKKKSSSNAMLYDDESSEDNRQRSPSPEMETNPDLEDVLRMAEEFKKEEASKNKPKYMLPGSRRPKTPEGEYRRKRRYQEQSDDDRKSKSRSPYERRKHKKSAEAKRKHSPEQRHRHHEEDRHRRKAPSNERGRRRERSPDDDRHKAPQARSNSRSKRVRSPEQKAARSPSEYRGKPRERLPSPQEYRGKVRERQPSPQEYQQDHTPEDARRAERTRRSPDHVDYDRERESSKRHLESPPPPRRQPSPVESRSWRDQSDDRRRPATPEQRQRMPSPDRRQRLPSPPRDDYRGNREDERFYGNRTDRDPGERDGGYDRGYRGNNQPPERPERPVVDRYGNKIVERDYDRGYETKRPYNDRPQAEFPDRRDRYQENRERSPPGRYYPNRDRSREAATRDRDVSRDVPRDAPPRDRDVNRDVTRDATRDVSRDANRDLTPYERDRLRAKQGHFDAGEGRDSRLIEENRQMRGQKVEDRFPEQPVREGRGRMEQPERRGRDFPERPNDDRRDDTRKRLLEDDRVPEPSPNKRRRENSPAPSGRSMERDRDADRREEGDRKDPEWSRQKRSGSTDSPDSRRFRQEQDGRPDKQVEERRRSPSHSSRHGDSRQDDERKRDKGRASEKSGDRGDRSGDRGDRSGDRGERSGDRGERSGDRGERPGDRGERSGDRGGKSGDRGDRPGERVEKSGERSGEREEKASESVSDKGAQNKSPGVKERPTSPTQSAEKEKLADGYESISEEEEEDWDAILKGSEDVDVDDKPKVDVLDIDWSSLRTDSTAKPASRKSALKRFTACNMLARIGISRELAGDELYNKVIDTCKKQMEEEDREEAEAESQTNETKTESITVKTEPGDETNETMKETKDETMKESDKETDKETMKKTDKETKAGSIPRDCRTFELLGDVACVHARELKRRQERQGLLDALGPYRRALCARADLNIRRTLCHASRNLDQLYTQPTPDPDLLRLSKELLFRNKLDTPIMPMPAS